MQSRKLFVRDPNEVPFLKDQVTKMATLADASSRGILVREEDDFGFMAIQFLYKQIQHTESVLILVPNRDAGLIARTMIEGCYQILWAYHLPEHRAKLWRSFAIIHDWRLMQRRIKEGIAVDSVDIQRNEAGLREFGDLHRKKKSDPNSQDQYHKNWRGGVQLADMADVVGRELYDESYSELSDWEHWGVSGIGDSISRRDNHLSVTPISERIAGLSLLTAFQCLFQTLELVDAHLSLGIGDTLRRSSQEFIAGMNLFSPK